MKQGKVMLTSRAVIFFRYSIPVERINAGNYEQIEIFFIPLMLHLPNFRNNQTINYL